MRSPRSFLYVPGDRRDRLAGAAERGADALIADLEDAVPIDRKPLARDAVRDWLAGTPPAVQLWARVNAGSIAEDVAAIVTPALAGIVVPLAAPTTEVSRAPGSSWSKVWTRSMPSPMRRALSGMDTSDR